MNTLKKSHVTTVICGGISNVLHNMLNSEKISLISGIAGEAEAVVAAYIANRLNEPRFYMPGYKKRG